MYSDRCQFNTPTNWSSEAGMQLLLLHRLDVHSVDPPGTAPIVRNVTPLQSRVTFQTQSHQGMSE